MEQPTGSQKGHRHGASKDKGQRKQLFGQRAMMMMRVTTVQQAVNERRVE
jgi:hypothetical protein